MTRAAIIATILIAATAINSIALAPYVVGFILIVN